MLGQILGSGSDQELFSTPFEHFILSRASMSHLLIIALFGLLSSQTEGKYFRHLFDTSHSQSVQQRTILPDGNTLQDRYTNYKVTDIISSKIGSFQSKLIDYRCKRIFFLNRDVI